MQQSFFFAPVTVPDGFSIIETLPNNRSSGLDEVPVKLSQTFSSVFSEVYQHIAFIYVTIETQISKHYTKKGDPFKQQIIGKSLC